MAARVQTVAFVAVPAVSRSTRYPSIHGPASPASAAAACKDIIDAMRARCWRKTTPAYRSVSLPEAIGNCMISSLGLLLPDRQRYWRVSRGGCRRSEEHATELQSRGPLVC